MNLNLRTCYRFAFISAMLTTLIICLIPISHAGPINHFDKIVHTANYLILSGLAWNAYPSQQSFFKTHLPYIFTFGIFIEIAQGFTEYRTFSWLDMLANLSGVILFGILLKIKHRQSPSTN